MTVGGDDPRLAEAKLIPIADVAERLGVGGLRRTGAEMVGPCPVCGGRDRFGINVQSGVFLCRKCDRGGDGLELVRFVLACDFRAALAHLVGERDVQLDPAEAARRKREAEEKRRRSDAYAAEKREEARRDGYRIWQGGRAAEATPVRDYLARRGIDRKLLVDMPTCLRFVGDMPYKNGAHHRGPAMLAAALRPDGRFSAVHQTFLDLSQPKGKARILDDAGEPQASKLVRGTAKGAAIRLVTPDRADTLVMGEGIETTLTAAVAGALPDAAYWAGISLGNMAGRRQRGKGLQFEGLPDMSDREAFVPPPWVRRLIFIQDGDSDPRLTRAQLLAGLRRAMIARPGLRGQIVHAGEGRDLNDILQGAEDVPEDHGAAHEQD